MSLTPDLVRLAVGPDAVVLVLPSLGLSVADLWGPVADLVDGRLTVVGVELPGHGPRARTRGELSIEELADAALAAVRAQAPATTPYVVAGVSIGGLVAQAAATRRPDLVGGLLLCNTLPRISTAGDWGSRATTVAAQGLGSQVEGALARWWGTAIRASSPELVRALSERVATRDLDSYLGLYAALGAFDGWPALPSLRVPVHLIAGAEDGPTAPAAMRRMADALDARLDVLDGVGHQAPLEAPEPVAAALLELARSIGTTGRTVGPRHPAQ